MGRYLSPFCLMLSSILAGCGLLLRDFESNHTAKQVALPLFCEEGSNRGGIFVFFSWNHSIFISG
ncbi:hypothetical protein D5F11_021605 [Siminovitchia terrae]|uniref:Lipoprotein n=1 Tax=Siminovitchia terrae TaxID=1914933 RepID=A0A429X2D4_SIMTE|nr:hypothetical protein [Siminovitchia terrae]RST57659.1 hypothetical protein D5F11_021605 [Siminovitchia terrae]